MRLSDLKKDLLDLGDRDLSSIGLAERFLVLIDELEYLERRLDELENKIQGERYGNSR